MKILIVDDNTHMRAFLRSLLMEIDAEFYEAEDGSAAATSYVECHPDIVLMDVNMPGMDGIVATRVIRDLDPGARICIVAEDGGDANRTAAAKAGAIRYFVKDDLSALQKYIENSSF